VITDDNILISLLKESQDYLALEVMGYYAVDVNKELFLYCMTNGNEIFMKEALKKSAFDLNIFKEEIVISQIITQLNQGSWTNYLLNILSLINLDILKNKHLKELINTFANFASESYATNNLLLSYNPLLTITLSAEILDTIAKTRKKLEN